MSKTERTGTYRDLDAWQEAMNLVVEVYRMSRKLPKDELFGLTSQMRRAVVSIPANIAEGCGRKSPADFVRFLMIARGSLMELETHVLIAERLQYLSDKDITAFWSGSQTVGRLVNGLARSLRPRKDATGPATSV